jgi:hypothetical protein
MSNKLRIVQCPLFRLRCRGFRCLSCPAAPAVSVSTAGAGSGAVTLTVRPLPSPLSAPTAVVPIACIALAVSPLGPPPLTDSLFPAPPLARSPPPLTGRLPPVVAALSGVPPSFSPPPTGAPSPGALAPPFLLAPAGTEDGPAGRSTLIAPAPPPPPPLPFPSLPPEPR